MNIRELEGWKDVNQHILNNSIENYQTDCLFFQIDSPTKNKQELKEKITHFISNSQLNKKVKKLLFNKQSNTVYKDVYCFFYKKKWLSNYSYNVYESSDFNDVGNFYNEKGNLIAYVCYSLDNSKLKSDIHIFEN